MRITLLKTWIKADEELMSFMKICVFHNFYFSFLKSDETVVQLGDFSHSIIFLFYYVVILLVFIADILSVIHLFPSNFTLCTICTQ